MSSSKQSSLSKDEVSNNPGSKKNERTVTDPITHLPVYIHDNTSIDLEQIPPSHVSKEEDEEQESQKRHDEVQELVDNEVSKGWWDDSRSESRIRTQTALLAAAAAAGGGSMSLFLSHILSRLFGTRGGSVWGDLFIGSVGSILLALGAGGAVFYYGQQSPSPPPKDEKKQLEKKSSRHPPKTDAESAAWLNSFLGTLWPIINPALFTPLSDMLEDALQSSLPKFISGVRVADLGQGTESVRIIGLRSLDGGEADLDSGDFINLEAALSYRAQGGSKGIQGQTGGCIHMLLQLWVAGGIMLPVWIELTGLLATARLKIQLTSNPPFLTIMTLTLLGQPKVSLSATPLTKHFLNVMDIPGLSKWIQDVVDASIGEYIAPRSLTLDLKTMLSGEEKKDTEAIGILVITIHRAEGFKGGDSSKLWKSDTARSGDPYVTVGWGKWGKPLWSTRTIQKESHPVWEETTFMLVTPSEVNAQEKLQLQLWDSDRFTADDILGIVDVPLQDLMRSSDTRNRITKRSDKFHGDDDKEWPGNLTWSVGFFEKTSLQQHLSDKPEDPRKIEEEVEKTTQEKLREAKKRGREEDKEVEEQTEEDLREKTQQIISTSPPPADWVSGILSITITQITGVEVPNVRQKGGGVGNADEGEAAGGGMQEEGSDALPSPYCTVIVNHEPSYRTRTKMKANNPYFNAVTEKFVRDFRSTTVMIAVRDSRLHEDDPLVGVAVFPLAKLFAKKSQVTDSYPLVGGMGFGRLQVSFLFRSVQAELPRELVAPDVGTLEIQPGNIKGLEGFPEELKKCRMLLRTLYGKGKAYPRQGEQGGWQSKHGDSDRPIRLAVKKRGSSCLLIQFRKGMVGPDQTPAFATLWLREMPNGEVTVKVAVRKNKGDAMEKSRFNSTQDIGEKIGELEMKVVFVPGLSSCHQKLAKKDPGIADVISTLNAARDDAGDGVAKFGGHDDSDSSSSSSSSESEEEEGNENQKGFSGRLRGLKDGVEEYGHRKDELHRKHRGLMQWGLARKLAWAGHELEESAHEVTSSVKNRLKHRQRDGASGMEREV